MDIINLKIGQIKFEKSMTRTKEAQTYIEAKLHYEDEEYNVKFSSGLVTFASCSKKNTTLELSREIEKYIRDILSAYVAGIFLDESITFSSFQTDCDRSRCKLEE